MRKLLWLGVSPTAPTGYGEQTRIFVPRIKKAGYDIAVSCLHGLDYIQMDWADGIRLYPRDYTGQNKLVLKSHVEEHGDGEPVQVITLYDIWVLMEGLRPDFDGLDIASWVPIDTMLLTGGTRRALDEFRIRPIAMSRFGETQLRDAGYDPFYVPHGIETDILKPLASKADCKKAAGWDDEFVVGIVGHNAGTSPARKGFLEMMEAFRAFQTSHPDATLYLHTDVTGRMDPAGGLPLIDHALNMGIPEDALRMVNPGKYLQAKISKEEMAVLYGGMDVLLNTSWGEGFGIPIVEAQACGTPVITTAWTSMPELTGAGWTVGGQPWRHPISGGVWLHPNVEEIVAALEQAHDRRDDQDLRDQARGFALQYDADKVMEEHWLPTLEALGKPREVPPLPSLNREQRRKLVKEKAAA